MSCMAATKAATSSASASASSSLNSSSSDMARQHLEKVDGMVALVVVALLPWLYALYFEITQADKLIIRFSVRTVK